jgi:hypothetical protein
MSCKLPIVGCAWWWMRFDPNIARVLVNELANNTARQMQWWLFLLHVLGHDGVPIALGYLVCAQPKYCAVLMAMAQLHRAPTKRIVWCTAES